MIDARKEKPQESCGFSFWNGSPIYSISRKFEILGTQRVHKRPDSYEIGRCKWWSDIERRLVKPELIVALRAAAARSLIGKTIIIQKLRGILLSLDADQKLIVTAHPSSLPRIPDRDERHRQYDAFVNDLRRSARYLAAPH